MVLVGWCALSAAPVVANSPALPAAFFVVAVGLVAAMTLRFSTLIGLLMAVLGTALFAVSMVLDPASAARAGGGIARLGLLVPALAAAISLVGVAVCASLTSWEIDGRPGAIQHAVARRPEAEREAEGEEEPVGASVLHSVGAATQERRSEAVPEEAPEPVTPPAAEPAAKEGEEPAAVVAEAAPAEAAPAEEPPVEEARREEPAAVEEAAPAARTVTEAAPERPAEEAPAEEPAAAGEAAREAAPAPEAAPAEQEPARAEAPAGELEAAPAAEPRAPEQPEAATAAEAPAAAEEKGEEIAARDIEEKNGTAEGDRLQPAGPDWRHRRRLDDDVARRLPRRRKR
jgi:hypothetical protein